MIEHTCDELDGVDTGVLGQGVRDDLQSLYIHIHMYGVLLVYLLY